jgi:hypothetical protein
LYAPSHQAIINAYQERIDELEKKALVSQNSGAQAPVPSLEIDNTSSEVTASVSQSSGAKAPVPSLEIDNISSEVTASASQNSGAKAPVPTLEIDNTSSEVMASASQEDGVKAPVPKESEVTALASQNSGAKAPIPNFEDFIRKTRNRFLLTSEPICNRVEGWQKETTFYINSYGKLSLTTPSMNFLQVENAIDINKFWRWLFNNQHRVGKLIDLEQMTNNLLELNNKYKDKEIKINGKTRWIEELVDKNEGVAIKVRNEHGSVAVLFNASKEPIVYGYDVLEKFL